MQIVRCTTDKKGQMIRIERDDGLSSTIAIADYPRLLNANTAQRSSFIVSAYGIHWSDLDEDISLVALFEKATGDTGQ